MNFSPLAVSLCTSGYVGSLFIPSGFCGTLLRVLACPLSGVLFHLLDWFLFFLLPLLRVLFVAVSVLSPLEHLVWPAVCCQGASLSRAVGQCVAFSSSPDVVVIRVNFLCVAATCFLVLARFFGLPCSCSGQI